MPFQYKYERSIWKYQHRWNSVLFERNKIIPKKKIKDSISTWNLKKLFYARYQATLSYEGMMSWLDSQIDLRFGPWQIQDSI